MFKITLIIGMLVVAAAIAAFGVYRYERAQKIERELNDLLKSNGSSMQFCATNALPECEGKYVTLTGTFSDEQQQRMFYFQDFYSHVSYLQTESQGQVVLYSQQPLQVKVGTKLEVVGKVIKVSSKPDPSNKAADGYVDYQLLVFSSKEL